MLRPTFLILCLNVAQHAAQSLLRPGHDSARVSSHQQGQQLTASSKVAKGVSAMLHVPWDPGEDDYVFAACVRLRELKLAWPTRPADVTTDAKMTVAMCSKRCKAIKSIHFALGGGDSCLCFDHFDAAPHEEDPVVCDAPCAGDPGIKCGGKGESQPLQVYTYAHHYNEPRKLCGPAPQPKGVAKVSGGGQLRSVTCAHGYVSSEPGGASLVCDADAHTWVPEGECITLEEALKKAKIRLTAATEVARFMKEKADKAEKDAADTEELARKGQQKRKDAQIEAARLSRLACKELTSAAPKVQVAESSTEYTAEVQGASARAKEAADALKKALAED
eukprot:gnl/MRDRNA2_/MRDRNA2_45940_c0_seq2.p1 gnl/MRDRNA2_/MRDRNA2_45940_c0~~gnl/MRDRNA2_/MRDRNA2_45940_c0_seq2.p1  ORF type:complete len:334 (-),score=91.58 gnl/MRDRNA2_/MRDRNA2_45940_c0_seq2:231-1232(-)